jgi:N-acetyl-beta-hexosaminidase
VFSDVNEAFKDSTLHVGGDEVSLPCFDENPDIKTFM